MAREPIPQRSPRTTEFEPHEWEGIAVRAQAEVARIHIEAGEDAILEQARAKVRSALPYAEPDVVDRRAAAIVRAAKTQIEGMESARQRIVGFVRECSTCRWGSYHQCRHPIARGVELHGSSRKTTYGRQEWQRSEGGACGPEAVLWRRRTPVQRWFDMEDTTWWVIPVNCLAIISVLTGAVMAIVFLCTTLSG